MTYLSHSNICVSSLNSGKIEKKKKHGAFSNIIVSLGCNVFASALCHGCQSFSNPHIRMGFQHLRLGDYAGLQVSSFFFFFFKSDR